MSHRRVVFAFVSILLCALAGFALLGVRSVNAQEPNRVVYAGLSKNAEGVGGRGRVTEWRCRIEDRVVGMRAFVLELGLATFSANQDCDELPRLLNGRLNVRWVVTARNDHGGFGTHVGRFTWTAGDHRAEGTMDGTIGCGTHRRPLMECERCRVEGHFEGVLNGTITAGPRRGARIKASYAGRLSIERERARALATLDGVYVLPCTGVEPPR